MTCRAPQCRCESPCEAYTATGDDPYADDPGGWEAAWAPAPDPRFIPARDLAPGQVIACAHGTVAVRRVIRIGRAVQLECERVSDGATVRALFTDNETASIAGREVTDG